MPPATVGKACCDRCRRSLCSCGADHAAGDGAAGGACRRDEARARPARISQLGPVGCVWLNDEGHSPPLQEERKQMKRAREAAKRRAEQLARTARVAAGGLHRCAPPPLAPYLAPLLPAPTPRADPCSLVRAQRGTTASCSTTLCSTRSTAPRTATSPRATFAGFSTPTARSGCGSGGARRLTLRPHSTGTEVDLDEDEDEDDDAARDDDALIDEEGRRVRRRRAAQPHADGGVSEL